MVENAGAGRQQGVGSLLEMERLLSVVFSLQQWRDSEDILWVSPP